MEYQFGLKRKSSLKATVGSSKISSTSQVSPGDYKKLTFDFAQMIFLLICESRWYVNFKRNSSECAYKYTNISIIGDLVVAEIRVDFRGFQKNFQYFSNSQGEMHENSKTTETHLNFHYRGGPSYYS